MPTDRTSGANSLDEIRETIREAILMPDATREGAAVRNAGRAALDDLLTIVGQLRDAIAEIVDAAEVLTRPGSGPDELVNGARMTNAVQAGAKLIGSDGIFPELAEL